MQTTEKKSINKIWLSVISVIAVAALVLGIVALVNHGDTKANAIPTINQQVDNIKNTLPELEKVSTELKGYIDTLEITTQKLQSDLTATNTAIDTLETEVYGKVDAEKTATLNQLKADKTELEGKIATANKAIEDAKAANTASEKAITDQIAALEAELEKADADNKKALEDSIAALEAALTQADADNNKALEDSITALKNAMEAGDASLTTAIQALNTNLSALIKTNADNIAALQTTATGLQKQLTDTNTKIDNIKTELEGKIADSEKKVLGELNSLKTDIEGQIATVNNTIATLQAKDVELDQKIADLQTYVDNQLANYATTDWANATFATLTQYEETQTTISEIKALIDTINTDIDTIENDVAEKVKAINKSIADLDNELAAEVKKVTDGYTAAIATAKKDITEAYTNAIKTAITNSENSMQEWVNDVLAEGYYTKAEIDGKITALQTQVAEGDAALQSEIDDLEADLEKAEADLTAAYKEAIEAAIANGGSIDQAFYDAVNAAIANLQSQIDSITDEIVNIKTRLDLVEADINSINQQIANINASIDALKAENGILKTEINCLKGIHIPAEYYDNLDGTHTYTCDGCGKDITESHNFVNNKCVCGATENGEEPDTAQKCLHEEMDKGVCKECGTLCYVDLGLPSGKLWATYNVGASNPWDYGDYFAWGETSPKDSYSWDTYTWGTKDNLTKYNNTDGKQTLEAEDDATTVNMGAGWSTPTLEDWDELRDHCTWEWTTVNGVSGFSVTGNGNSIFLPATGRQSSVAKDQGTWGCYWLNSRYYYDYDLDLGMAFMFDSSGVNSYIIERMVGMCVRAVYAENN